MSKHEFDIDAMLDESERLQRSLLHDVMIPRNLDEMLSVVFEGPEHEYTGHYNDRWACYGCLPTCPGFNDTLVSLIGYYEAFVSWYGHPAQAVQCNAQRAWRDPSASFCLDALISDLLEEHPGPAIHMVVAYAHNCGDRLMRGTEPLTWPVFIFLYENPGFGVDDVEE